MLMMLYTYFLLLITALVSPLDKNEAITECIESSVVEYSIVEQNDNRQLAVCLEYNSDLRAPVSSSNVLQRESSSQNVVRHRGAAHERVHSCGEFASRQGHTTHILEFDKVRSSLRKAYYLHTLCRLRI